MYLLRYYKFLLFHNIAVRANIKQNCYTTDKDMVVSQRCFKVFFLNLHKFRNDSDSLKQLFRLLYQLGVYLFVNSVKLL